MKNSSSVLLLGVLPAAAYSVASLHGLGQANIVSNDEGLCSKDVLGRVYEYFLGKFAADGKLGGEFSTLPCVTCC